MADDVLTPTNAGPVVPPVTGPAEASSGYRSWVVGVLTVAFGLNLLDRQIINILAEPIKRDIGLSDAQLGMLTGLSFALLYSVAAIPIARFADRGDRVRIVGIAILVWSFFTAACGAATSFIQLLLLRVGVGVGEAGCAPPSQSLIADYHPPAKRSSALAVFALGAPIGAATGLVAGGLLAGIIGWRWTLVVAGAPGILIGLLVLFTVREPRRAARSRPPELLPLSTVAGALARRRSFVLIALGCALLSFVNYSAMAFAGSFYLRVHATDLEALGTMFGIPPIAIVGIGLGLFGAVGGAVGAIGGGILGDQLARKDVRALTLIPAAGSILCALSYFAMFTVPAVTVSLAIFFVASLFSNLWHGPGTFAMQRLAGAEARATALAVSLFINSAIGLGLGPLTVGLLSDSLTPTMGLGEGLRLAILIGLGAGVLSAVLYALASRYITGDIAQVADES